MEYKLKLNFVYDALNKKFNLPKFLNKQKLIPIHYKVHRKLVIVNFTLSRPFFLLDARFFGDFRKLDLKLPFLGNLTIQDGGTIILLCTPATRNINYNEVYF